MEGPNFTYILVCCSTINNLIIKDKNLCFVLIPKVRAKILFTVDLVNKNLQLEDMFLNDAIKKVNILK